jgi:hypothetical protein
MEMVEYSKWQIRKFLNSEHYGGMAAIRAFVTPPEADKEGVIRYHSSVQAGVQITDCGKQIHLDFDGPSAYYDEDRIDEWITNSQFKISALINTLISFGNEVASVGEQFKQDAVEARKKEELRRKEKKDGEKSCSEECPC